MPTSRPWADRCVPACSALTQVSTLRSSGWWEALYQSGRLPHLDGFLKDRLQGGSSSLLLMSLNSVCVCQRFERFEKKKTFVFSQWPYITFWFYLANIFRANPSLIQLWSKNPQFAFCFENLLAVFSVFQDTRSVFCSPTPTPASPPTTHTQLYSFLHMYTLARLCVTI